jgi:hypothetical protein
VKLKNWSVFFKKIEWVVAELSSIVLGVSVVIFSGYLTAIGGFYVMFSFAGFSLGDSGMAEWLSVL